MIVYTEKDAWECEAAEQYLDGVHLLDADGQIIVVICDPNRILRVEDGEIKIVERPEPNAEERVEALEAAVTMLCMPDASEV